MARRTPPERGRRRGTSHRVPLTLLHTTSPGELRELLHRGDLTEEEMLVLVRRRNVPRWFLEKIAQDRRWSEIYQIRCALARNPKTPRHLALPMVKKLLRRELAELARDVNCQPGIRRLAEHLLRVRMEEMAPGERMALARSATTPLLRLLLRDQDARVVDIALASSRTNEEIVLEAARSKTIQPESLRRFARSPRWARRYPVCLALIQNPSFPSDEGGGLIGHLLFQDLLDLMDSPVVPLEVRLQARRRLAEKIRGLRKVEKIALAPASPRIVLELLLESQDVRVVRAALRGRHLVEGQVVSLARTASRPSILAAVAEDPRWMARDRVRMALEENPATPEEIHRDLRPSEGGERP